MTVCTRSTRRLVTALTGIAIAAITTAPLAHAKSDACEGGGFVISGLLNGVSVPTNRSVTIPASNVGPSFQILGKNIEFTVVSATFGIENYTFTGAANPEDISGGRRTVAWQSKTPDHRGLKLTSGISVSNEDGDLVLQRTGTGLKMKIQAKDCAQGGIFQMEPERNDKTATKITHTLATGVFYFDNPNFRAREGDIVAYKDTTLPVPSRINIANDVSRKFVTRDSSQSADRIADPNCSNQIRTRTGAFETVQHCGQTSSWMVASGGRMGFVTGEDAIEVAPGTPDCTSKCRNRSQTRGQSVKLGHPFPVPAASRLNPALPPVTPAP
jgi:hypothetical protein